jgi:hypothetical protein
MNLVGQKLCRDQQWLGGMRFLATSCVLENWVAEYRPAYVSSAGSVCHAGLIRTEETSPEGKT